MENYQIQKEKKKKDEGLEKYGSLATGKLLNDFW